MDPKIGSGTPHDSPDLALVTDDREWIERIRGSNVRALETLFGMHVCELTAFAFRYVQSYDATLGIVYEVFVRLWRGRHSWAFHGSVRGNLFAATHRVALEELHRTHNESRWHAGLPTAAAGNGNDSDLSRASNPQEDVYVVIQSAIARLPAVTRTVGFMRWADRLTRAEIATVLGSNARTVYTQITPASRAMRRRLASANWTVGTRASKSTLRDPSEGVDPFPMIDPDRIECYLAGESLPAEEAQLRRDVSAAGGDPAALDAMESAWFGPGRIIAEVVDQDGAWGALSRRLSLPRVRGGELRRRWRPVPDVLAALAVMRTPADSSSQPAPAAVAATANGAGAQTGAAREGAKGRMIARLGNGMSILGRLRRSMSRQMPGVVERVARTSNALLKTRAVRTTAIVVGGLALTAVVWAFAWRQAQAASDAGRGKPAESARVRGAAPQTRMRVAGQPAITPAPDRRASTRAQPGGRARDLMPLSAAAKD